MSQAHTHPFIDYPAPKAAPPKPLNVNDLGPPPSIPDCQAAIAAIQSGPPSILLFKHYHWLTGKPVPERRNLETNDQYVKSHWRHLKRAAKAYVISIPLDITPPTS